MGPTWGLRGSCRTQMSLAIRVVLFYRYGIMEDQKEGNFVRCNQMGRATSPFLVGWGILGTWVTSNMNAFIIYFAVVFQMLLHVCAHYISLYLFSFCSWYCRFTYHHWNALWGYILWRQFWSFVIYIYTWPCDSHVSRCKVQPLSTICVDDYERINAIMNLPLYFSESVICI